MLSKVLTQEDAIAGFKAFVQFVEIKLVKDQNQSYVEDGSIATSTDLNADLKLESTTVIDSELKSFLDYKSIIQEKVIFPSQKVNDQDIKSMMEDPVSMDTETT